MQRPSCVERSQKKPKRSMGDFLFFYYRYAGSSFPQSYMKSSNDDFIKSLGNEEPTSIVQRKMEREKMMMEGCKDKNDKKWHFYGFCLGQVLYKNRMPASHPTCHLRSSRIHPFQRHPVPRSFGGIYVAHQVMHRIQDALHYGSLNGWESYSIWLPVPPVPLPSGAESLR